MSKLKDLFRSLNSKNIVYNKAYYRVTGSVQGAILLSHLSYLYSEVFGAKEFYQSDAQLMESLGFSERTLRTAKDSTKKYAIATKRGVPAKNHWIINEDLLIEDLVSSPVVKTSHVENVRTVDVENVTCKNKELLRSKENKNINNNSVVVEKVDEELLKRIRHLAEIGRIPANELQKILDIHNLDQVHKYLAALTGSRNIKDPVKWLNAALRNQYNCETNVVPICNPASFEEWSPQKYAQSCKEAAKMSDPNDWREKELQAHLAILTKQMKLKD